MAINAKIASAYVDLVARTEAFEKALDDARSHVKKFNVSARAEMMESKAAIAMLGEAIGVHIPRHLQTVINKLPGVSAAMNAAFVITPMLLAGKIIFEAGEKVVEFAKKNEEAARKNTEAWGRFASDITEGNDQLRVTNDKLEEQIAKIEHKPKNALKTALDEAAVSADELGKKIDADWQKLEGLMKQQAVGMGKELFGQASTGDIQEKYTGLETRIREAQEAGQQKIRAARDAGDKGGVEKARANLDAELRKLYDEGLTFSQIALGSAQTARKAQEDWASGDPSRMYSHPLSERSGWNSQDMTGRINMLSGGMALYGGRMDRQALDQQSVIDQERLKRDQGAQDAATERLKRYQIQLEQLSQKRREWGLTVGPAEERAFWEPKLKEFDRQSEQYRTVLQKFNEASVKTSALFAKARKDSVGTDPGYNTVGASVSDRGGDQLTAAITRHAEAQADLNAQWSEARTQILAFTGVLSPHQALMAQAEARTADYQAKIGALRDQLADLRSGDGLSAILGPDKQNQAKEVAVQTQIDLLLGKQKIEEMRDSLAEFQSTWRGSVDGIYDEIIRRSEDTQRKLQAVALQTVDAINTELAKGMTGGSMDFKRLFQNAAQGLAKTGLERIEGGLLKEFGLGTKVDGSAGRPFHAIVDNLPGNSDIPDNIAALFGGKSSNVGGSAGSMAGTIESAAAKGLRGWLNDSDFFSSIFGGKFFGAGGIFGGGHALGGDVAAGVPIDVGELGRERFIPSVPGRIVPHSQLGGGPLIGYIDARNTDPALSRANFEQALTATHHAAVASASHAITERARRRPV